MLEDLKIATPCSVPWESMTGDDRKRFCGKCSLFVHNIEGLTRTEAEELVTGANGRLCVRLFKRADGTVLTQDCPVGLRALRLKLAGLAAAITGFFFLAILGSRRCPAPVARPGAGPEMGKFLRPTPLQGSPAPLMGEAVATPR